MDNQIVEQPVQRSLASPSSYNYSPIRDQDQNTLRPRGNQTSKLNCLQIQVNASSDNEPQSEYIIEGIKSMEGTESSGSKTVESLKAKIATLEKANQQIYDFAASLIIDRSQFDHKKFQIVLFLTYVRNLKWIIVSVNETVDKCSFPNGRLVPNLSAVRKAKWF